MGPSSREGRPASEEPANHRSQLEFEVALHTRRKGEHVLIATAERAWGAGRAGRKSALDPGIRITIPFDLLKNHSGIYVAPPTLFTED